MLENAGEEKEINPYEMPVSGPSLESFSSEHSNLVERAKKQLSRPATAITIMSSTMSVFHSLPVISCILEQVRFGKMPIESVLIAAYSLTLFCLSVIECIGAAKMGKLESLPLAYGSALLCLVPFISPFIFLGIPFGIWSLLLLRQPHIRHAFQLNKSQ